MGENHINTFGSLGYGDWVEHISPGEQQRLAFARIFAQEPKLVILDEATSALDLALEADMYGRLREKDITVISVAHRQSVVKYHTHVLCVGPSDSEKQRSWRLFS